MTSHDLRGRARELRQKYPEMTGATIARRLGISSSSVSNYLNGRKPNTKPPLTLREQLALREINAAMAQVEADSQQLLSILHEHPYSSISQLEKHTQWSREEVEGLLFDLEQKGKARALLWTKGRQFVYRWVASN